MRLVQNWRQAWKWLSVQLAILAGGAQAAMLAFPTVKDWVSDSTAHTIGVVLIASIVAGRLIDQKKPDAP